MAGPGGGPPRKSHTKSRKGCTTCKRRHIRCDETYPQCRNCTKHSCRCDYMDRPPVFNGSVPSPRIPNLVWSPDIDSEVDDWIRTGVFPFPELALRHTYQFSGLHKSDLRLVYHMCSVYRHLHRRGLHTTTWVERLPTFLDVAAGFEFVMNAILAFSATHLGEETNSHETRNLAYTHRALALNGLRSAIDSFSDANSDPILAASILLSWQASDWGEWTAVMNGTYRLVSSMDTWKDNSALAYFVETQLLPQPHQVLRGSLGPGLAAARPGDDRSLSAAISALQYLSRWLQSHPALYRLVEDTLQSAQEIQICSTTMSVDQLFDKLQLLRFRFLWAPPALVQAADQSALNLVVAAHLYALALAIDASLPELGGAAFGALTMSYIEEIDQRIRHSPSSALEMTVEYDQLMQFPRHMCLRTRSKRSSVSSYGQVSEPLLPGEFSAYSIPAVHMHSAPSTPPYPTSFPVVRSQGTEELPLLAPPSPENLPNSSSSVSAGSDRAHLPRRHSSVLAARLSPFKTGADQRSFSDTTAFPSDTPIYSPPYSPLYFDDTVANFMDAGPSSSYTSGNMLPLTGSLHGAGSASF